MIDISPLKRVSVLFALVFGSFEGDVAVCKITLDPSFCGGQADILLFGYFFVAEFARRLVKE